ncbi:MAG: sugar phosphate nucleotidyltransferase, partial [Prevotella sp.]|nr:sugar phosphate nucleotidyltransferase [Prevotella sp.]
MARINNHLVIMAGGVGSRFWPMSTVDKPKQFIDVLGVGRSLMQLTFDRFEGICDPENVWIVTNKRYFDIVREQLPEVPKENILLEPCRRNTAPCIAYVSWRIKSKDPNANIVVSPSDHIVTNPIEFRRVVESCLKFTSESDAIVTLGMKPTRPETGYGYIQADLGSSSVRNKEIFR